MDKSHNGTMELGKLLVECNRLGKRNHENGERQRGGLRSAANSKRSERGDSALPESSSDDFTGGVEVEFTHFAGVDIRGSTK